MYIYRILLGILNLTCFYINNFKKINDTNQQGLSEIKCYVLLFTDQEALSIFHSVSDKNGAHLISFN